MKGCDKLGKGKDHAEPFDITMRTGNFSASSNWNAYSF
jgi:hypothetical protein